MSALFGGRYDSRFVLNMSSAAKVECIVDKVKSLAAVSLEAPLPADWFRHIIDPELEFAASFPDVKTVGTEELAQPLPFLPFTTLLITGTAGAGKTSSVQTIASNIDCVITATTSIAAQNLSCILNRSKASQVKTIYRAFGFNSSHISMRERQTSIVNNDKTIEVQQKQDLSTYWNVISDIADKALAYAGDKTKSEVPEFCESNVIVIDESGVIIRYMLHTVAFFYWFYNAVYDTELYRSRAVPCIVCVGSPTQSGALVTHYDPITQNKDIKKGFDVLSALISDEILSGYCNTPKNWIIFINNKRCLNHDFGDFLKHIEFGLPLKQQLIDYVDRFVRPAAFIRNPMNEIDTTRLFLSHHEVRQYFKFLHEQIEITDKHRLFIFPVYCLVKNKNFEEYKEAIGNYALDIGSWFTHNLNRINSYSQFVDQDLSKNIAIEEIVLDDGSVEETLITCQVKHIRNSSIGVNAKMKSCVVGYSGRFDTFVELLQSDLFIERTSYDQAVYAYSFLAGLLFSGMYSFCCSEFTTLEIIQELKSVHMPDIEFLQQPHTSNLRRGNVEDIEVGEDDYHDLSAVEENEPTDEEMLNVDPYSDNFFSKYSKPPPTNSLTFEDISLIYTTFKDIFITRFYIMQKHSNGRFGKTMLVTYNRNNVSRRKDGEIVSDVGSFYGMLSYAVPVNSYTLEGFTYNNVMSLGVDKNIPYLYKKGLPRLVVKDTLGFISILDNNVAKFVDSTCGSSFHLCTTVDYGIVSKVAMTVTKSQGLSIQKVAIDFGNDPKNLKLSSIYVAMSRVVDPDNLIMNLNPLRLPYENDNSIATHIVEALKNKDTLLIF